MPLLILWVFLLPPAFALAAKLKKSTEECLPLYIFGLIAAGYLLSIVGLLRFSPLLIYFTLTLSLLFLAYSFFVKKTIKLKQFLTPGLLVFLLLSVLAWQLCRGFLYSGWDEFSHWGRSLKNMYFLDNLYTVPQSNDGFKDYPPALAIFQYILLKAGRFGFREDIAIFCAKILPVVLLALPVAGNTWKKSTTKILGAFLCYFTVIGIFLAFPYETSIDSLIGIVFAFMLFLCYSTGLKDKFSQILLLLACFVLPLFKAVGLAFAALSVVLFIVHFLFFEKERRNKLWEKGKLRFFTFIFSPLAVMLLANFSWKLHISFASIPEKWQATQFSIPALLGLFTGSAPQYRYETLDNFVQQFFVLRNYGNLVLFSPACWVFVFLAFGAAVYFLKPKEQRKSWCFWVVGIIACFLVYALFLLVSYLFLFDPREAVVLASFTRYLNSVVLAAMLFLLWSLFAALSTKKIFKQIVAVAVAALVLVSLFDPSWAVGRLLNAPTHAAQTHHDRYLSMQSSDDIAKLGVEEPRVYFIAQRNSGEASLKLDFELTPNKLPDQQPSIGTMDPQPDAYTAPYTLDDWQKILYDGFDYVYLYTIDSYFVLEFTPLFENPSDIENRGMFEVVRLNGGKVTLQKLF